MRTSLRIWAAGMAAALLLPLLDAAAHAGYYLPTLEAPTTAMVLLGALPAWMREGDMVLAGGLKGLAGARPA